MNLLVPWHQNAAKMAMVPGLGVAERRHFGGRPGDLGDVVTVAGKVRYQHYNPLKTFMFHPKKLRPQMELAAILKP